MAMKAAATSDHGLPALGLETILAAQRRYLEGWADASRIMTDAMRAVAQRQVELAESEMRAFWAEREAMGDGERADPVDRLCAFYERAFAHFQETSDIVLKAQSEAMQVFSDCAAASFDELKKAA